MLAETDPENTGSYGPKIQTSWNFEFESSPIIESTSYKLKSIHNNSPELSGYLFNNIYPESYRTNPKIRANMFAVFSDMQQKM